MKKKLGIIVVLVAVVIAITLSMSGCASCSRNIKSMSSDFGGGLNRTGTVYDYNGETIKSWSGKFDVSENDNEIFFDDENGKRVIIHGGIVICEEN